MPLKPQKLCGHPGCNAYATTAGRCAQHQRTQADIRAAYDATTRRNDPALAYAAQVRGSSRWQAVRRIQMHAHPFCCDPFKLHGKFPPLAKIANHIVPLRVIFETGNHELAFDLDNLASLCTRCDASIGAMERAGKDTTELFKRNKEIIGYE